jgi:NO-binding membrane sensor protein with MHYT domain/nitrogen-specific signal transduction histidine kinase
MMDSSYNPTLVAISVAIASLASYSALDLAGRVTVAQGRTRLAWLASGSAAMGLGIWSMHFVGMLAFHLPTQIAYQIPLVVLSALIAIAASGLAMFAVSRVDLPAPRLVVAGLIMGVAIAGMHYVGMAAMRLPASITYDPIRFWLSIGIAVTASIVALWIAFHLRHDDTLLGRWRKVGAAVIMGFAIAGMHYTGMSAARFAPMTATPSLYLGTIPNGAPLAIAVIGGAVLVLALALAGATLDRRAREAEAEHARLRQLRDEMEAQVVKRTAELRAALVEAEQANLAKSHFLARMSHELRTPLNSVIGFANLLQKHAAENLRPQERNYVERIGANGRHLLSLINNILDLAKVEAGHMTVDITDVDPGPLVADVVAQLEGALRDRPVKLVADLPAQLGHIPTDEGKLRQILVNLIGNAIKFTESGSVTVRVIANSSTHRPERIDVIDTGIGIPADRINAIFSPFEQADTSTTRMYGGTGLGLAITRSFCGLLGAELTVTKREGAGLYLFGEAARHCCVNPGALDVGCGYWSDQAHGASYGCSSRSRGCSSTGAGRPARAGDRR